MEIKYLRKKDSSVVYIADSVLLKRNDLYPCEPDGTFISSGSDSLEVFNDEFEKAKEDLYKKAEELKITNYRRMKFSTLIDRIVRIETERTLKNRS
tara:strand:+ start:2160 stop:2447 length:288 start_codon:yes stop_codon:yes gene_type:complete